MSITKEIKDYGEQIKNLEKKIQELSTQKAENFLQMKNSLEDIVKEFIYAGYTARDTVYTMYKWLSDSSLDKKEPCEDYAEERKPGNNVAGWTVTLGKDGYYRGKKRLSGKLCTVYLGVKYDTSAFTEKVHKKENEILNKSNDLEKFKHIEGYQLRYKISNYGRVFDTLSSDFVKPYKIKSGKLSVWLKNGRLNGKCIHVLVAEYFCDNPNNYKLAKHKNGNVLDNKHTNLEWFEYMYQTKKTNQTNASKSDEAKEVYVDIKGYKGLYKISTHGNVYGVKAQRALKSIKGVRIELSKKINQGDLESITWLPSISFLIQTKRF